MAFRASSPIAAFNDPQLAIAWPREVTLLSDRDRALPTVQTLFGQAAD
jgi:dTDP-4-dehydrorhamnose 3,5-epimerase